MSLRFTDTSVKISNPNDVTAWDAHVDNWIVCERCPLNRHRRHTALARGTIPCDMLILGEGPGNSEDHHAAPFVGPAGQVLQRALDVVTKECAPLTYLLANIVACRPCNGRWDANRKPRNHEIAVCQPRVIGLIKIARPALIVSAGRIAETWLNTCLSHWPYEQRIHIDHPSYIMRKGGAGTALYDSWITDWIREIAEKRAAMSSLMD